MRIVAACDGLAVSDYFGRSTSLMCYNADRGIITWCRNIPLPDQSPDAVLALLQSIKADTLIVGLIEYDTAAHMCRAGIEVVAGASGEAGDVVKSYLSDTLAGIHEPCDISGYDDSSPSSKPALATG